MRRPRVIFLVAASLSLVLAACDDPSRPDERAVGLVIPAFSLTDHDGRPITEKDLLGHVTIVDFIFTDCPFVCPTLTARMSDLADRLRGTRVRFLSVSVNPDRDTAERLREYAALHEADLSRWTFARGTSDTVRAIVEKGLKFALEDDPKNIINLEGGATMTNIIHPSWMVLVNADGHVVNFYGATGIDARQNMDALEARARAIASKLPRG